MQHFVVACLSNAYTIAVFSTEGYTLVYNSGRLRRYILKRSEHDAIGSESSVCVHRRIRFLGKYVECAVCTRAVIHSYAAPSAIIGAEWPEVAPGVVTYALSVHLSVGFIL